jgi:hypothetical protein
MPKLYDQADQLINQASKSFEASDELIIDLAKILAKQTYEFDGDIDEILNLFTTAYHSHLRSLGYPKR